MNGSDLDSLNKKLPQNEELYQDLKKIFAKNAPIDPYDDTMELIQFKKDHEDKINYVQDQELEEKEEIPIEDSGTDSDNDDRIEEKKDEILSDEDVDFEVTNIRTTVKRPQKESSNF